MLPSDRTLLLAAYPALLELSPAAQARLEALDGPVRMAPGDVLFGEGEPVEVLPLVLEGVVKVSRRGADGREVVLYRLQPGGGCLMAIGALLGETLPLAAGTAETEGLVLRLPREHLLALLVEAPAFRRFVLASLARGMARVLDLAFTRVDERLAARLLLYPQPLVTTHRQLADDLGTSREVVTRILGGFQEAGLIRLGRKRIELLDRQALQRLQAGRLGPGSSPSAA